MANKKREKVPRTKIKIGGKKMRIGSLETIIKKVDGKAMTDDEDKALTLRAVMVNALLAQTVDDRNLTGEEKVRRFKLAMRINSAKAAIDVTPEQATKIRKLIARVYTPLIVGQSWELIDPEAVKKAEEPEKEEKTEEE